MSIPRSDSLESICSVLTLTFDEFKVVYDNETLLTEEADSRYRLDDLLSAMLLHAPNASGQRYIAVCLRIAHQKGEDGVVNAAKAWLDNLLLPSPFASLSRLYPLPDGSVIAISKAMKTEPASSQTLAIDIQRST
ncbi:hypothetical protein EDB87DRAFT_1686731 [Lactarius vividus]|nr:hypothetical protein EDB87DRAFT_1686731 [Lactarius vividus]